MYLDPPEVPNGVDGREDQVPGKRKGLVRETDGSVF
jgi:hypothetical protein